MTFACRDAYDMSSVWKAVLGYSDVPGDPNEPRDEECRILGPDGERNLLYVEVPEGNHGAAGTSSHG